MERARSILILAIVLELATAACAADAESGPEATEASTVVTATAATSPEAPIEAPPGTPTGSTIGPGNASTTTLDPGAAGTFDFDYLRLGAGASFVPLDDPVMVPATEVDWLRPDSIILGVVHPSGAIHAFPADMLAYHHIANTTIAGEPYLVTY